MSEDINVTDGTVLECLNNKVDLDGGNYVGSPLEQYIHEHCGGGGGAFELFDTKLSDHILSYEETKGWALQGSYVHSTAIAGERYGYPDFVNKCMEEKEAGVATQVTLGSSTITMYINSNGHQFYDIKDKGAVDYWFNTYGIADFYGVDTENECVFLPRNIYFMQLTNDITKVNDMNEAGLPTLTTDSTGAHTHTRGTMNITGSFQTASHASEMAVSGAFTVGSSLATHFGTGNSGTSRQYTLNAANNWTGATSSNGAHTHTIAGTSDTVQPPSSNKLLYYCVGNTVSNTSWVDVVTQVEAGVKDLEDKTLEGIERLKASSNALTTTQTTNCLLEVPQRIKYTLENGTLTIKAGSVVIVPYGTEDKTSEFPVGATFLNDNFKVYDTQFADGKFFVWAELLSDLVRASSSSTTIRTRCIIVDMTTFGTGGYMEFTSGSSDTTSTSANYVHYNTTTNTIAVKLEGSMSNKTVSLPILLYNSDTTYNVASVTQVFNGMGYIGSTIWVDKGVKGLIPNGRNEDGSLKNIEVTSDKLYLRTYATGVNNTNINFIFQPNNTERPIGYVLLSRLVSNWEDINYIKDIDGSIYQGFMYATGDVTNGVITSFNPKQPFRAVDFSQIPNTRFDGQVTYPNRVTIFNTTTLGTYAVDLSAYVPDDGCGYDLYVAVSIGAGADADGNDRNINIYDATGVTLAVFVSDAINKQVCSNAVLPLKPSTRAISVSLTSTNNATFSRAIIYLNAVRRRGTNG